MEEDTDFEHTPTMGVSSQILLTLVISQDHFTNCTVAANATFYEVLDMLDGYMQANNAGNPTTAFEYIDDDNDRITVRSDDELRAMITWHQAKCENLANGKRSIPLVIYPRLGRSESDRNIHKLTVDVDAAPVTIPRQGSGGSSGRTKLDDIPTIMNSGHISHQQLDFLGVVGHGNGGVVHKALHLDSNKVIAVKVIPLDITEEIQRQILSELNILFKCNTQFIIGFYGAFFVENKISICTEFMDGGSLDLYGKIPQNVVGRIAVAVVKGMQYLWELKIIHRDVKPNNILVNSDGFIKLCDFGVSIQLVYSIAQSYVGTNAYMAPERISGNEYGIRSDVWSFGLSLVEMSTGIFPYPTSAEARRETLTPFVLLQCIVNESPPRLSRELFGDALRDFVEKCLQKNPKSRPTPEQLLRHPFITQNDTENQRTIVGEFIMEFHRARHPSMVDEP